MQRRGGKITAAFMETFASRKGAHLRQPSSTLARDKGLANDAPIQCTEGFGHAAQLQAGKDTTRLTRAVSHISTDLNSRAELTASPCSLQALISSL